MTTNPDPDVEMVEGALRNHYCNNLLSHRDALAALSRISSRLEEPKAYVHRDRYEALEARLAFERKTSRLQEQEMALTLDEARKENARLRRIEEAARGPADYCARVAAYGWPRCLDKWPDERRRWCGFCILRHALEGSE